MFKNDEVIGHSKKNLVLKTSGNIRVLVGDKYYNLNFRDEDEKEKTEEEDDKTSLESNDEYNYNDIIIVDNISEFGSSRSYPGDKKIIFTLDGNIYYTLNNSYNKYLDKAPVPIASSTAINFNQPLKLKGSPAIDISDTSLIRNLNAEYLNGKKDYEFIEHGGNAKINSLTVDSIFSSDGKFSYYNGKFNIPQSDDEEDLSCNQILEISEIECSKLNYYSNDIYDDVCEILSRDNLDTIENISKFLEPANVDIEYIN